MNTAHLPNTCGVYMISNKVTGDTYIGSSVTVRSRVCGHRSNMLNQSCSANLAMRRLCKETGIDAFEASVLIHCETIGEARARELEQIAIRKPTLNATGVAKMQKIRLYAQADEFSVLTTEAIKRGVTVAGLIAGIVNNWMKRKKLCPKPKA